MYFISHLSPDEDSWGHTGAFYVGSSGSISGGSFTAIEDSYGSPGTNMASRVFYIERNGEVSYDSAGAGGVASYGLRTSFLMR